MHLASEPAIKLSKYTSEILQPYQSYLPSGICPEISSTIIVLQEKLIFFTVQKKKLQNVEIEKTSFWKLYMYINWM